MKSCKWCMKLRVCRDEANCELGLIPTVIVSNHVNLFRGPSLSGYPEFEAAKNCSQFEGEINIITVMRKKEKIRIECPEVFKN